MKIDGRWPNDSAAIVPMVQKAREAGILFITLDSPLDPLDAADATFATDNFKAGDLIGKWAAAQLGDKAAEARIGFLDLNASQVAVDYLRDQGFMQGFGIDVKNPKVIGDEDDKRIVGHAYTDGADPAKVREALMGGFASSKILEVHAERMIKRTFDPGFRIALHQKDLNLALSSARQLGVSLPNTAQAQELFNSCVAHGGAAWDHSGMVRALEIQANFEIGQKAE